MQLFIFEDSNSTFVSNLPITKKKIRRSLPSRILCQANKPYLFLTFQKSSWGKYLPFKICAQREAGSLTSLYACLAKKAVLKVLISLNAYILAAFSPLEF